MRHGANILVVDDDPDDHEFFREAVKYLSGHHLITSVYNGLQALDFLLKRGAYKNRQNNNPDFIVLDLNMPILNGFATFQAIREHPELKSVPIYVLTTSEEHRDFETCKKLGCAGIFTKPPKLDQLSAVIKKMIR